MNKIDKLKKSAWSWVPSLYFAEGLPYIFVTFVAIDMYKTMGISNTSLSFWTGILYLPWVVKPLWSPFVELYGTKRKWIILTQFVLASLLLVAAISLKLPWWYPISLIILWITALISATHDIAADGFYMIGLNDHQQAFFTGIRSTFYRLAMIAGMGGLVILTGYIQKYLEASGHEQSIATGWLYSILILATLYFILSIYHHFIIPKTEKSISKEERKHAFNLYWKIFADFFKIKGIYPALAFLLLYRLAESQIAKMASPFLLDARDAGGLALTLSQKGFAYGTLGLIALLLGGISGGIVAAKHGLKKWIWWMAAAINLPNIAYIYLAFVKPTKLLIIDSCIAIEQFGYGFGFTGYMLFMLYLASQSKHKTAHFAIATGFMALGMMLPGMISGYIQELLGYQNFFIYVMICTIPGFLSIIFIKIDPQFGLKKQVTND